MGGGSATVKASGEFTISSSSNTKISCGFQPKYIYYYTSPGSTNTIMCLYDETLSTTQVDMGIRVGGTVVGGTYTIGSSSNSVLYSVDYDGFTVGSSSSGLNGTELHYVAIGDVEGKISIGSSVSTSSTSTTKITCGFRPKYICAVVPKTGGTAKIINVYNEDFSTTKGLYSSTNTSSGYIQEYTIGASGYYIKSIDSDGFTLSVWPSAWVGPCYYFAVG